MPLTNEEKDAILERLMQLQGDVGDLRQWRQLEAVWLREKLGLSGSQTAAALNYRLQTVHLLWHRWLQRGLAMFEQWASPGGRKRAYLTPAQERDFLETLAGPAAAGALPTVAAIRQAYEARVGQAVALSTVYRLLQRHGWRKVAPRKRHPRTKPELQAEVKKTHPDGNRRG